MLNNKRNSLPTYEFIEDISGEMRFKSKEQLESFIRNEYEDYLKQRSTVRIGDTLERIAQKLRVAVDYHFGKDKYPTKNKELFKYINQITIKTIGKKTTGAYVSSQQ